ncbi:uracil-DNA glycosylase family protein [Segatella bryantii]|uniref:uracil-DNA glycosylase family protein n=1 Tax=Segatella bryantii TaxID=77095 RepID=UPI00087E99CE|nr:uracil-DNA glycosylase family protein [Segatella bryantii]SDM02106.1 G/U mismatch-specific uracil-DNA glycosylase [Segatella bryantii]SDZ83657.1 G/U mismatch-specific uracil-DNA glycosylase [Segatella bryantii]
MPIETHPFEPWLPKNARLLMLGTFPPSPKRWCMDWYYPNFMNDMWRIFGICFFDDKQYFIVPGEKRFALEKIKTFLEEKRVAIFDTALRIRRTKGTASDKDLEIVEPADLDSMLRALPDCRGVLTAGQLATQIFTEHYGITAAKKMKMGSYVEFMFEGRSLRLYRMPSSSRAYPMATEKKAEYYQRMFDDLLK